MSEKRPMEPPAIPRHMASIFLGPRPGSNAWPLLRLETAAGDVMGEDINAWIRGGLFEPEPIDGEINVIKGGQAGPYGDIPDVDLNFRYYITAAGEYARAK